MLIQILILLLLLGLVPLYVGGIPAYMNGEQKEQSLALRWVSGQFLLWAGFQLICVPMVLRGRNFTPTVILFGIYTVALLLLTTAIGMRCCAKNMSMRTARRTPGQAGGSGFLLWIVFFGLLLFQLVQAVRLAYADGDDAYYVAVSTISENAETMYQKLPYTGGGTELDVRHGLAPFPIWVAFLARVSGLPSVTMAHVMLPVALIIMTYAIFYLLGCRIFPDRDGKVPLFLIFTEVLVLFGNYSFYTAETFMIARSRQGKAALGSIVIPFLFYLLLEMLQRLQEKEKIPVSSYLQLATVTITGCLCSTLGALLICMLMGIVGVLGAICYKERRILVPMAVCCVPCVCYAVLYLVFG